MFGIEIGVSVETGSAKIDVDSMERNIPLKTCFHKYKIIFFVTHHSFWVVLHGSMSVSTNNQTLP